MDIQVEKLRQALDLVSAAMPRGKVTLPITTSVLFRDGKVTATNLELWISVELAELGRSSPSASLKTSPSTLLKAGIKPFGSSYHLASFQSNVPAVVGQCRM